MGWKLRKDKLRADAGPEETAQPESPVETTESSAVAEPLVVATGMPPVVEETSTAFIPYEESNAVKPADEPVLLDKPEQDFDSGPTFESLTFEEPPSFDDTPTFGQAESASDTDFPAFAPLSEESEEDTLSAFAPYQPAEAEPETISVGTPESDEPLSGLQPEVGGMEFAPELPNPVFEPAFEAPNETPAQEVIPEEAAAAADEIAPNEPFMNREALAAGLVTTASETGLPLVSPFILGAEDTAEYGDFETGPPTLTVRLGGLSAAYPITKPVMTIGRPDSDTQNYPDVEVELDDGVSRKHAEVRHEGDEYLLVDLGSTNGTSLNGELLTPNQPVPLMHGDHIRIGERTEIVYE